MLVQRRRRWTDVVQMLYKSFVLAGIGFGSVEMAISINPKPTFISPFSGDSPGPVSLYVHKGGLKPDSFHFISEAYDIS